MSIGKASCLVCGEPLKYAEATQTVECEICHKKEEAHAVCQEGHYVCDTCHRMKGVQHIMEVCLASDSCNPIELAQELMRDKSIYPNGPEHHTLVGATLLTAYINAGGELDKGAALEELRKRSLNVPGGTCGFWGCCGAAISAGMFTSIATGSTPMTTEPWGTTTRITSIILGKMADVGGPRCCKRTSFTSIEATVAYVDEVLGVKMELPQSILCEFMNNNEECLHEKCPYFS